MAFHAAQWLISRLLKRIYNYMLGWLTLPTKLKEIESKIGQADDRRQKCPNCDSQAELVSTEAIYSRGTDVWAYVCSNCTQRFQVTYKAR